MIDQDRLPAFVSFKHTANLRQGNMTFINHEQVVIWKEVQ